MICRIQPRLRGAIGEISLGLALCFLVQGATAQSGNGSRNGELVARAKELVQRGDPGGAFSALQDADLKGAGASDVHALKGTCLALLGKPVESAGEFDEAIALRPKYAPVYFSSGLAFASFDNLEGALERFSAALKLDPGLPGLRYNEALVLARAGRFADSEKEVDRELANAKGRAESARELWRLKARDDYAQKKWPETIVAYRKALEFDPNWPEAFAAIGEALFTLDRGDESLPVLEKAESLDPANGGTHALLGKLYQEKGDAARAISEFEQADRLRPDDQDVIFRLYRIYSRNGDTANAARMLSELKELIARNNAEAQRDATASEVNNAGVELEKRGDLAGALDDFDRAAREDATNLVFQRNAALMLCRLGRIDEAIRRLRDTLAIDPDDAETLQILAVAREFERPGAGKTVAMPSVEVVR